MNRNLINDKVKIAIKIRKEMHRIYTKHNVSTVLCNDDPNTYSSQIDEKSNGFECEFYYSSPNSIYTPIGELAITCNYMSFDENAERAIKEIKEVFGMKLKREAVKNYMGVFGGWYYITKLPWSEEVFECDMKPRKKEQYIDYETARKIYREILEELEGGKEN